jgi:hypothetical protein
MSGRGRGTGALAGGGLALAAVAAFACTDVATGPGGVVSIEFDSLPSQAIVRGDSLRDVNGVAVPLRARAFNVDGEVIPDAPVRYVYVASDTAAAAQSWVQVDSVTGYVVSAADAGVNAQGRLAASVGTLPAEPRVVTVVPRPDTAGPADPAGTDTLRYAAGDSTVTSGNVLEVVVLHDSASTPVQAYTVTYAVDYAAPAVADSVRLSTDGSRPSTRAVTASNGIAGRRLRVYARAGAAAVDSVVVSARVTYLGVDVRGSPVRLSVQLVRNTGA